MTDDEATFEIKVLFLRELAEGHAAALKSLDRLLKLDADPAPLKEIRNFFHKIAGTAASAELPLLGTICGICEGLGDLALEGVLADPQRAARLFREALDAVQAVIEQQGTKNPVPPEKIDPAGLVVPDVVGEGRALSKIVVIDDDPYSARMIDSCLRQAGFMSSFCSDSSRALATIEAELPDLVILDVVMPAIDGFALCRRIREHPALQLTPIIFVTRKDDVDQRVRGLKVGGNDYIAKPFEPKELVARVRSHLQRLGTLRELAIRDGLTRCFNHKYFKSRVLQEIARAARYHHPLALAMLDVDHFKAVNDRHGHPAGDTVLAYLAGTAMASVRSTDVVARYGGEEFALLMIQASASEAGIICDRMRQRIAGTPFRLATEETGEIEIPLAVSIGISAFRADDDVSTFIARADEALYRAKREGRNRVVVDPGESAPG